MNKEIAFFFFFHYAQKLLARWMVQYLG